MSTPVRDFHCHSNCSDGLYCPGELVEYAARSGVEELSLTDHDTVAGLEEAGRTAQTCGVRFMPGMELTSRFRGRTVHVLGYGFGLPEAMGDARLTAYLDEVKRRDHRWAAEMCRKSCESPLVATAPDGRAHRIFVREEELSWARGTMPSAFHLAVVLAEKLAAIAEELSIPARHCFYLFTGRFEPERREQSYWPELRARYASLLARFGLSAATHWWVPRPTADLLDAEEAIQTFERIGALPVVAHPGEQELTAEDLGELAALGLRGLEIYTYKHGPELVGELEAIAESLGLFATGGTDFHDPHHRAWVKLGRDRAGSPLTRGLSIDGFRRLGACR